MSATAATTNTGEETLVEAVCRLARVQRELERLRRDVTATCELLWDEANRLAAERTADAR